VSQFTGNTSVEQSTTFESKLQAYRLRAWNAALEIGFAEHSDPAAAVDAAVEILRRFDADILTSAEHIAAKAGAR